MKKYIIFFFLLFSAAYMFSQNLVPNGSFETFITCPTGNSMLLGNVPPWQNTPGSFTTPDYFNACVNSGTGCNNVDVPSNFAGSASAFDGSGYAGIFSIYTGCPNCREYFAAMLTSPLIANQTYNLSMRLRLGSWSLYSTDKMGMYVSSTLPNQPGNQPINFVVPQVVATKVIKDTTQWTLLSATYIAAGGEQYVTVGCFYDNTALQIDTFSSSPATCALANAAAFYYIDSIIVEPVTTSSIPVVSLSSSDTLWCDKTCIDFFDLSQNNPTSWTWYFQGASPATSTDQNPTGICYNNYGSFDVTLVACNAFGCDSLFLNDFVTEFQLPPPPTISMSNDTLFASPAYAYQWYNTNNINTVISTANYLVPGVNGNYFVLGFDSNGCATPSATFGFYTGINSFVNHYNDVVLLAMDGGNNFCLQINSNERVKNILLVDVTGKQRNLACTNTEHPQKFIIDLSNLAKGVYLVKVDFSNNSSIRRLIKL